MDDDLADINTRRRCKDRRATLDTALPELKERRWQTSASEPFLPVFVPSAVLFIITGEHTMWESRS